MVADLSDRWQLTLDHPFDHADVTCSWVAPARRSDGQSVVLKVAIPHMEAADESHALRELDGDPTVYLLECDASLNAMLLERCHPGSSLRSEPDAEQDRVVAELLPRFWRLSRTQHAFRPLSEMVELWAQETRSDAARWQDASLVEEGLKAFRELARPDSADVLLATDLHAGNVLRAERRPWLVIDPKPFVGDPAFDVTQHLFNMRTRLEADPERTIGDFALRVGLDPGRVRRWVFARAAAEPRENWAGGMMELAYQLRAGSGR